MTNMCDYVQGPFKDEQEFKQAVLKKWKESGVRHTSFELENEEKEPGMPDVITLLRFQPAFFAEFKYADKNGVIEFRKSQPLFYQQHRDIDIRIFAWDGRMGGRTIYLDAWEVLAAKSLRIKIPEKLGVCE
jgi:hypothetical protein